MGERAAAQKTAGDHVRARADRPRRVAVDGSAASGKSTIGRRLAERLEYAFLDTGVMYRAVTHAALERKLDLQDSASISELAQTLPIDVSLDCDGSGTHITIDGSDVTSHLRSQPVEEAVSLVSRIAAVREALVSRQRELAEQQPIVMAGRDIGTVVLPNADLKVYLDASIEERARRRYADFLAAGDEVSQAIVLEDIRRRDRIDSEREVSPLRPADDAVIINTNGLSLDDVMDRVLGLVRGDK
ncbi:MAG: (d)CMP kinase [Chloroflexi bacterium]|nr:MAG: (d)CMP kinase [Chloroflexota bacterium]